MMRPLADIVAYGRARPPSPSPGLPHATCTGRGLLCVKARLGAMRRRVAESQEEGWLVSRTMLLDAGEPVSRSMLPAVCGS